MDHLVALISHAYLRPRIKEVERQRWADCIQREPLSARSGGRADPGRRDASGRARVRAHARGHIGWYAELAFALVHREDPRHDHAIGADDAFAAVASSGISISDPVRCQTSVGT
jgi:hypothetical protein